MQLLNGKKSFQRYWPDQTVLNFYEYFSRGAGLQNIAEQRSQDKTAIQSISLCVRSWILQEIQHLKSHHNVVHRGCKNKRQKENIVNGHRSNNVCKKSHWNIHSNDL